MNGSLKASTESIEIVGQMFCFQKCIRSNLIKFGLNIIYEYNPFYILRWIIHVVEFELEFR